MEEKLGANVNEIKEKIWSSMTDLDGIESNVRKIEEMRKQTLVATQEFDDAINSIYKLITSIREKIDID